MIDFERPEEPPEFDDRARPLREAVQTAIEADERPDFDSDPLWTRYKDQFARAQHGKCAYCEMSVANHDPAVDHYAPKSEVWELSANEDERGREIAPPLPNVRGRTPARKSPAGYWWRAYEWSNFLVVCTVCNSKWKQCYFPIAAEPRQWPPRRDVDEAPLLLNPYDDPAPWREFCFGEDGVMVAAPDSARGRATLDTLGFERRESARLYRAGLAGDAHRHTRAFADFFERGDTGAYHRELENLRELGDASRDHAGMVRAIAEAITGFRWDTLMALRRSA